jgi:hypothetical protein
MVLKRRAASNFEFESNKVLAKCEPINGVSTLIGSLLLLD